MKAVLFPQIMGSDQLMHVDGRFGRERIIQAIQKHRDRIQKFHSTPITKAQVFSGRQFARTSPMYTLTI